MIQTKSEVLLMAVHGAIEKSIYIPLVVTNNVLENIDSIEIHVLKKMSEAICYAIADDKISDIDYPTWAKLKDEIDSRLERLNETL